MKIEPRYQNFHNKSTRISQRGGTDNTELLPRIPKRLWGLEIAKNVFVNPVEVYLFRQNNYQRELDFQIGFSRRNFLDDQESELETKKLRKYDARKISHVLPPFQTFGSFNISFLFQNDGCFRKSRYN